MEFNLVAEGLRKIALLWQLIKNGTLEKESVLFWDEPEANINPEYIPVLAELLIMLESEVQYISFTAKQGEVTALIGPSGGGKTMISRFAAANWHMVMNSQKNFRTDGITVLSIVHRMRTAAEADKIVVLKDGLVVESGSPAELEKKNGIYAGMVKTQLLAEGWSL